MSVDELWALYTVVDQILAARIVAKKQELDRRLEQLHRRTGGSSELSVRASSSGRDRL
jgi:DNA-binding protein H-NS